MNTGLELSSWHAFDGCARFLLRSDGTVIRRCAVAVALIDAGIGFCLRDGRLFYKNQILSEGELNARIGVDRLGLLHRQDNKRFILAWSGRCDFDGEAAIALMLRVIGEEARPQFVCLADAFQLTQAEEKILCGLLNGSTPFEIAQSEGTSINTVRTHIAHIYGKLEARNREEMWMKCAPFMVNRTIVQSEVINAYDANR